MSRQGVTSLTLHAHAAHACPPMQACYRALGPQAHWALGTGQQVPGARCQGQQGQQGYTNLPTAYLAQYGRRLGLPVPNSRYSPACPLQNIPVASKASPFGFSSSTNLITRFNPPPPRRMPASPPQDHRKHLLPTAAPSTEPPEPLVHGSSRLAHLAPRRRDGGRHPRTAAFTPSSPP